MFVKLIVARMVGNRWWRVGSIVEVPEDVASRFVRESQAVPAPGATEEHEPPAADEKPRRETATLKPQGVERR